VDDPLDAVAVHGGGGLWGLLGGAILKSDALASGNIGAAGLFVSYNLLGALVITAWAGGISLVLFGLLRKANLLRVSEEEELEGMDLTKHSEPAYPGPPWHGEVKSNENSF